MRAFWLPLLICGCVPLELAPNYYAAPLPQPENCGTPDKFKDCRPDPGTSLAAAHPVRTVRDSPLPWSHRPYVAVELLDAIPQEQFGPGPFSELGRGLASSGVSEPSVALHERKGALDDADATTPMAQ
jgi:hypothetical protein